ncbi:polyketide synthase [Paenibacillus albidus]|uniref:Polyketide synthase n=1 Tax=Paenibacillus albidus TaxID=2041023 RepID=A0A917C310_9BACL|nr:type I polyketide synthase [Paenibacillus albidus]GGF69322.1 polyketide synthase [Paenibacillus albidus]
MSEETTQTGLEIAVIGMSGKFPGADNLEQYWELLMLGASSVTQFSYEELRAEGIAPERLNHPDYVKAKPYLGNVYDFDASLFGYAPWEAGNMDPQIRLFHEIVYHALENSGYHPDRYDGQIGMYAGAPLDLKWTSDHLSRHGDGEDVLESGIVSSKDFLSQLISYKLNLTGPSYTLYTACSTSLAAVHLACQGLLLGDCNLAVAGGVTLEQPGKSGYLYQEGTIYSKSGVCRPFDSRADGTIFGEGAGAVVLKRLSEAIDDGDHIYAVIKGSSSNNDGRRKVGFAAPSLEGQKEVIRSAWNLADIEPDTIGYIETHGTGTKVGDPIEFTALQQVFGQEDKRRPIGSVKGNIGHLHAAAGIAGLIKTALSLEREMIPPTANYAAPNPLLEMEKSAFYLTGEPVAWPRGKVPRRAGISSFGVGGTNVHLILEEPPIRAESEPSGLPAVLLLSAKSPAALERMQAELSYHLENRRNSTPLADVAYTLQMGRGQFKYRLACVAWGAEEAVRLLGGAGSGARVNYSAEERINRPVVFMFTGQGAQTMGMGAELYRRHLSYRQEVDRLAELLLPKLGRDIRRYIGAAETEALPHEGTAVESELHQTWLAQPALFVLEYALAQAWMKLGVRPALMAGHSIGEYVAATLAGVFTLDDALDIVVARGRLMQSAPGGMMLAAAIPAAEADRYVSEDVSLAAINQPGLCVFSGEEGELLQRQEEWNQAGIFTARLNTSHAFHSARMDGILEPFREVLRSKRLNTPGLPFCSCLTGELITGEMAVDPEYWTAQLRGTVNFSAIISGCLESADSVFLEVGPGQTLCRLAKAQAGEERLVLHSLGATGTTGETAVFLETLSRLWLAGVPVQWEQLYPPQSRQRLPLPMYSFDRQTYLPGPTLPGPLRAAAAEPDPSLLYLPAWKQEPLTDTPGMAGSQPLTWLILREEGRVAGRCRERLMERGDRCIEVLPAGQYRRLTPDLFELNPVQAGDYLQLADNLRKDGIRIDRILHAWMLEEQPLSGITAATEITDAAAAERGYLSIVHLAAALDEDLCGAEVRLTVAASRIFTIFGSGGTTAPERRAILGPILTLSQERPGWQGQLVDFQPEEPERRLTDKLWQELTSPPGPAGVAAYRSGTRLIQAFDPFTAPAHYSEAAETTAKEIYLVVSPAGGAELIRSFLAARPGAEVITSEGLGSAQLKKAIAAAAGICGRIDGVVYEPELQVLEWRTLAALSAAEDLQVPASHTFPELNTLLLGCGAEIGFGWILSSLSSVVGGLGLTELAAAAGVLDAAAEAAASRDIPWLSLSRDFIRSPDSPAGPGITREQEYTLYERLWPIRSRISRAVISAQHPVSRLMTASETPLLPAEPDPSARPFDAVGTRERPAYLGAYEPPATEPETIICEIITELLGVHPVGVQDHFYDLGGHSLLLTRLLSRIKDVFRAELPLRTVMEKPTVAGIIDSLMSEWGDAGTVADIAEAYREYQRLTYEGV